MTGAAFAPFPRVPAGLPPPNGPSRDFGTGAPSR